MSEALKRIYASNPVDQFRYVTLELRHPEFTDRDGNPSSIYLVQDSFEPINAQLENGAEATFLPVAFEETLSSEADQRPSFTYTIDGSDPYAIQQLERQAVGEYHKIEAIRREYVSTDLSKPAQTPFVLTVRDPNCTPSQITFTAEFADVVNKAYPGVKYTLESHPALI